MLINKLYIPQEELIASGLLQIEMSRLGKFVALTGTNGAGKTRFLNTLIKYINNRNQHVKNVESYRQNIENYKQAIILNPNDKNSLQSWRQELSRHENFLEMVNGRVFSNNEVINPIQFVPKLLNLSDARQFNKSNLLSNFNEAKNPGFNNFEQICFSYIQQIQNREWAASHQRSTNTDEEKNNAKIQYEKLCKLIDVLLKAELTRSIDDDALLFKKPLAEAGLSEGQKVLIQLLVALHAQDTNLQNAIFIMDEPENHLHPSALIEFLDALSQVAVNSQFWIATHSVPLLSHIAQFEPTSIWYVENGKVTNSGSNPIKVLKGLLGNDDQIAALNNFTSLPAQFAATNHATECLFPPKVIGCINNDPQISQINNLLNPNGNTDKIAILDFGAGKSRLLSGLNELATEQNWNIKEKIDYFAYDSFPDDKEISIGIISEIYGIDLVRHFSKKDEFFSLKDESCIDVVVMCNVLHEISPKDWLNIFDPQSLTLRSLKDSGYLLIVEDQRIPVGEKAHEFGFLVLDTPHLKTLFKIEQIDIIEKRFQVFDHREDGRLKAHLISKSLLTRITGDSRKKSIEQLRATAEESIIECRTKDPSYKIGQLFGFWTQQFANSSIYLKQV